jgi:hypothetical protein
MGITIGNDWRIIESMHKSPSIYSFLEKIFGKIFMIAPRTGRGLDFGY